MSNVIFLKETESTNKYLHHLLKKEMPEEGTVVVTENQLAGKGQASNTWESEKGKNLTCSMILYPDFIEVEDQFIISKIVSLAVADTLKKYVDDISIKWPNDIYYKEKKITGILIENNISGNTIDSSIIGIGININQEVFTSNAPNPVSLKQITGKEYDLNVILKELMTHLFSWYTKLLDGETEKIDESYFKNLFRNKGYYLFKSRADNEVFNASIKAIKPSGLLVLETDEKEERIFAFKEVEFIIN